MRLRLGDGRERIDGLYQRSLRSGRITEAVRDERLGRLTTTLEAAGLSACQLVVEAVFEDMAVKLDLLTRLAAALPRETVIATNTSYLDIEAMADIVPEPGRFIGLHFFSPANIMKLLEIVRGRRTSSQTLATGIAIARKRRKIAVVSGVCDGFIGNRILAKFRPLCEFRLVEGALRALAHKAGIDTPMVLVSWARAELARAAAMKAAPTSFLNISHSLMETGLGSSEPGDPMARPLFTSVGTACAVRASQ